MKRWMLHLTWAVVLGVTVSGALGSILYEDVVYWMPDGSSQINPSNPPLDALVKVQETVYDDHQGKGILGELLGYGLVHGDPIPTFPMDLYVYSVTNLTYGNGPSGISGFHVGSSVAGDTYAPNAANSWWGTGPGDWDWDIDANANGIAGDGLGILMAQTFGGFMVAVPAGTPHGFVDASAHSFTSEGGDEVDVVRGLVSGPIPEPASLTLLLGCLALVRRRR